MLGASVPVIVAELPAGDSRARQLIRLAERVSEKRAALTSQDIEAGVCHGDVTADNFNVLEDGSLALYDFSSSAIGMRAGDLTGVRMSPNWEAFLQGFRELRHVEAIELDAIDWMVVPHQLDNARCHLTDFRQLRGEEAVGADYVDAVVEDMTRWATDVLGVDLNSRPVSLPNQAVGSATGGYRASPVGLSRWSSSPSWCPRPVASVSLFEAVRAAYELDWDGEPVDIGGSSNLNLHVPDRGNGHVLRVHRAWVSPARLDAVQSVRSLLAHRGLPFVEPLPARSGARFITVGSSLAEVERFVVGDDMDHWRTLMLAMPVLARIHSELRTVHNEVAALAATANHVDARTARTAAARGAAIIRSWARSVEHEAIASSTEQLAEDLWHAEAALVDRLDRQLVHGDFWDNNVKFRGDDVIAVLDLDFMEARPRIDDLALTLYYAYPSLVATRGEDGVIAGCGEIVKAYALAADPPLEPIELQALPLAIARSALHFTRHLALRANQHEQREVVAAAAGDLDWALAIVRNASRWQEALQ